MKIWSKSKSDGFFITKNRLCWALIITRSRVVGPLKSSAQKWMKGRAHPPKSSNNKSLLPQRRQIPGQIVMKRWWQRSWQFHPGETGEREERFLVVGESCTWLWPSLPFWVCGLLHRLWATARIMTASFQGSEDGVNKHLVSTTGPISMKILSIQVSYCMFRVACKVI